MWFWPPRTTLFMEMRFLNLTLEGAFPSWGVEAKKGEAYELSMVMFFTMSRNPVNGEKECSQTHEEKRR